MYKQQCCRKLLFVCDCYLQTKVIFVLLLLVPSEGLSLTTNCHTLFRADSPTSFFSTPSSADVPLIKAPFRQFLALCLSLFVVGWTDGSTGPLLPRIQVFYDVSWVGLFLYLFFFNLLWFFAGGIRNSVLDIYFTMYSKWCLLGRDTRCRDVDALFRE